MYAVRYYQGHSKFKKDILKYNEIDCQSMYDILNYMRTNH